MEPLSGRPVACSRNASPITKRRRARKKKLRGSARRPAALVAAAATLAVLATGPAASGDEASTCSGFPARALVLLSAKTGAIDRTYPDVATVVAVVADGRAGWFVHGTLCRRGKKPTTVFHLDGSGRIDRVWRGVQGGFPMTLADGVLYLGGERSVHAYDAATGRMLWQTRVNGRQGVFALAAGKRRVYVGGDFTQVDGARRPALAALDSRTGRLLDWRPPTLRGAAPTVAVDALALAGARLFVGGNQFTSIGGHRRPGLAALDARTGALTAWVPGTVRGFRPGAGVGDVETILVAHGEVFTAGHDGFGVTDARTGQVERWMYALHGEGYRFAAFGSTAYLGGDCRNGFDGAAGQPRNNLAAVDLMSGTFTTWAPNVAVHTCAGTMAAHRDHVLVGGDFFRTY